MEYNFGPKEFNAEHGEMGFYLVTRALDIDNHILGRDEDVRFDKLGELGEMLSKVVEKLQSSYDINEPFKAPVELGFMTWNGFHYTFNDPIVDYTGQGNKNIDFRKEWTCKEDIDEWAQRIFKGIREVSESLEKLVWMPEKVPLEQKERLRDFCNNLSRGISTYQANNNPRLSLV